MAKLDKEMMKKQHFWLLLIPLFVGLLLAWLGLFFGVAGATAEMAEANQKEKTAIDAAKAQSKQTLKLYDERKEELFKLRTQRWKEMWDQQKAIFEWPEALGREQIDKVEKLPFGAEISDPSFLNAFRDEAMKGYEKLVADVAPLHFAGDWRQVLRYVPAWKRNPESEDVWLAMEDYWVQREILRALAGVNKEAAQFKRPSDFPENDPRHALKNDPRERTFIGRTWQLDLKLVDKSGGTAIEGAVTNLTSRLQPFNANNELVFNVWLSNDPDARPFRLSIEGTSLEGGKKEPIKFVERKHKILDQRVVELFKVEQVFDVRTVPVKRLDKLALGYPSARHSRAELQMTAFSTKAATPPEGEAGMGGEAGGMGSLGGPPGGMGSLGGPPGGTGVSGPGLGGAATSTDLTYNGLSRRRYVNITGQVRAMPVGLVVVADQAFVQDVLTAVANCKLRYQTVQALLSRFRGSLSYATPTGGSGSFPMGGGPPPAGEGEGGPIGPPAGPPGVSGGAPRQGSSFGPPPGLPGAGSGPGMYGGYGGGPLSSSDDQTAGNLIQIEVHGIAALYEKFQPPKTDDAAAGSGTDPATSSTTGTGAPAGPTPTPNGTGGPTMPLATPPKM